MTQIVSTTLDAIITAKGCGNPITMEAELKIPKYGSHVTNSAANTTDHNSFLLLFVLIINPSSSGCEFNKDHS
ncbi:MAG TPA: hypothetical protein DD671_11900, partial [Balneolaceae bacterium]|nr:hypothetical protein [Balneolaceae bacterium]